MSAIEELRKRLDAAIDAGAENWQAGCCHELGCGCVSFYLKTAMQPILAALEAQVYPHLTICNGDRHYPAGEPGHCCCCLNVPDQNEVRVMRAELVERRAQVEQVEKLPRYAYGTSFSLRDKDGDWILRADVLAILKGDQ